MAAVAAARCCLLLVVLNVAAATSVVQEDIVTIDLGGDVWTVTNGSMTAVQGTVPGQVHTDLLAAGVIDEPFNGMNQENLKWVAYANWTYEREFDVPAGMLAKRVVQLVSMGIDTIADVFINENHVYFTDNMFHRVRLDVKSVLREGGNKVRVQFYSKVAEAQRRANACDNSTSIICPLRIPNACQHGFDNVNYLRTEPCSFSWDWGPGFSPVGLWRPIYLQAFDSAVVRDVTVVTTPHQASPQATELNRHRFHEPADAFAADDRSEAAQIARAFARTDRELDTNTWDVDITVYLDGGVSDGHASSYAGGSADVQGSVVVQLPGQQKTADAKVAAGGESSISFRFTGVKADPWMPNGFGSQPLSIASAVFQPSSNATHTKPATLPVPYPLQDNVIKGADGALSVRFGFRQVELVQNKLPGGKSYFFRVNGVPIPVKGSNWIPADAFESRVSRNSTNTTRLAPLFRALKESHQNMIRNWGGGIYQRDSFYDLADENGILIWEDLMWACAEYAVPPAYLESSAKEVRDNVRRMQHHPSIALWAGNNEDEADMKSAQNTPSNPASPAHIKAYSDLTFRTALSNVTAIDTSRPLSGSSPSDGNETAEHPFSWDHQSQFYGDVHCYLYDADSWDHLAFKRPRFMSEFGLQSWPSAITMAAVFPSSDWSYYSDHSLNRNHHPNGQNQMLQQIAMHFHLPNQVDSPPQAAYVSWSQFLWLTQLNQALGYKTEVEHFRRIRTDCSETVPGCNMGRMFWQTNDIWQGASWAAIDYTGRYKMVQYFAQRFYAPFLVSAFASAVHGVFGASVINDNAFEGDHVKGEVRFQMHSWSSGVVGSWTVPFDAPPGTAVAITNSSFVDMLRKGNCPNLDATLCFLTFDAFNGSAGDTQPLSSNYVLLAPFYDVDTMIDPELSVTSVTALEENNGNDPNEQQFAVTISVSSAAAFVWAETHLHGHWSDNGVLVPAPGPLTLVFFSDTTLNGKISADDLKASLKPGHWPKPNLGGLWSLTDTSKEYTSGGPF